MAQCAFHFVHVFLLTWPMLSNVDLFEVLTLLFALRCAGGIAWDWLINTKPCVRAAAEWLVMSGREILDYRELFDPAEDVAEQASVILAHEHDRFDVLTSEVLVLFRQLWNGNWVVTIFATLSICCQMCVLCKWT